MRQKLNKRNVLTLSRSTPSRWAKKFCRNKISTHVFFVVSFVVVVVVIVFLEDQVNSVLMTGL